VFEGRLSEPAGDVASADADEMDRGEETILLRGTVALVRGTSKRLSDDYLGIAHFRARGMRMRDLCLIGLAPNLSGRALERTVAYAYHAETSPGDTFPRQWEFVRECGRSA
jgi:hypothetical protein